VEINFGTVDVFSTHKDSVLVSNSGTDTLLVSEITSTNEYFTITPDAMTIVPLDSVYIIIAFTPLNISDQFGHILLTHNAVGSVDSITVSGKGDNLVAINHDQTGIPTKFSLSQNYPNPFNLSTIIEFALPEPVFVELTVYSAYGQKIADVVKEELKPGNYKTTFDARLLANGIYFYRIQAGSFDKIKKLWVIK